MRVHTIYRGSDQYGCSSCKYIKMRRNWVSMCVHTTNLNVYILKLRRHTYIRCIHLFSKSINMAPASKWSTWGIPVFIHTQINHEHTKTNHAWSNCTHMDILGPYKDIYTYIHIYTYIYIYIHTNIQIQWNPRMQCKLWKEYNIATLYKVSYR